MTFYRKSTLPGGLRVITEEIPHVRSVSVGVWVSAAGCWETPENMGISHYIEHMLFKGTTHRTARQIASAIDGRGGNLNAFTAKENTCYYAKVLDEHFSIAVDVLGDMVQHSLLSPADMEKEKGVIIEEIKMYEDIPDDLVHDIFAATIWPDHPLGRPIVGTVETVQSFTREQVLRYMRERYTADNMVIAVAGHVSHDRVVEEVARVFAHLGSTDGSATAGAKRPAPPAPLRRSRAAVRLKETEQAHLVLGMTGLPHEHPDLYALHVLNTILGGGSSSRLFQEIREERGLAYSVYSFQSSFLDSGNFGVYAGTSPEALEQVLMLVQEELRRVGEQGITPEELVEAKDQLKGQMMLSLESTSGRMSRLGRGELILGRVLSPDQIIDRIDAVTLEQVHRLAARLFLEEPWVLSVVGPVGDRLNLEAKGFAEVIYEEA